MRWSWRIVLGSAAAVALALAGSAGARFVSDGTDVQATVGVVAGFGASGIDRPASRAALGIRSPQSHEGITLLAPEDGATFNTNTTIDFSWETIWVNYSENTTLHWFVGTSSGASDVVDQRATCPPSTSPSCPTSGYVTNLPAGTYYWGVTHSITGIQKNSEIYSFSVTAPATTSAGTTTTTTTTTTSTTGTTTGTTTSTTTTATTGGTTTTGGTATTASAKDSDQDGVVDASDRCPSQPAGQYDSNHDGCAGPWAQIKPRFAYGALVTSGGLSRVAWISISKIPEGALVRLQAGGRALNARAVAGKTGAVRMAQIGRVMFSANATFTVSISRAGWIGYYGVFRVPTTRKPYPIRTQCIPAVGPQKPTRCRDVDRGR